MTALGVTFGAVLAVMALWLAASQRTIRDLRRRLADAERAAGTDPLTGLANRVGLHKALTETLRERAPVAVLFLDVDRLKLINDQFGHPVGDAVLVEIARRITRQPGALACAARLGGDEFVIVLAPAQHVAASQYADAYARALSRNIATRVRVGDLTLTVAASIGIAVQPADSTPELLRAADQAMYWAKHTGTGICHYDPDLALAAESAPTPWWSGSRPRACASVDVAPTA